MNYAFLNSYATNPNELRYAHTCYNIRCYPSPPRGYHVGNDPSCCNSLGWARNYLIPTLPLQLKGWRWCGRYLSLIYDWYDGLYPILWFHPRNTYFCVGWFLSKFLYCNFNSFISNDLMWSQDHIAIINYVIRIAMRPIQMNCVTPIPVITSDVIRPTPLISGHNVGRSYPSPRNSFGWARNHLIAPSTFRFKGRRRCGEISL